MRIETILLAATALGALSSCGRSEEQQVRDAMSEISVVTQRTGAGAALAEDAVVNGVTFHPLGQHAWNVTPDGKAANIHMPLAEFRAMTGDSTPVRRSAGLVSINISPVSPLHDPQLDEIEDIEPFLGLRRSIIAGHPDRVHILWLPEPYEGKISCPARHVEDVTLCALKLNRGQISYSVGLPSSELPMWRARIDGFLEVMDRAKAG